MGTAPRRLFIITERAHLHTLRAAARQEQHSADAGTISRGRSKGTNVLFMFSRPAAASPYAPRARTHSDGDRPQKLPRAEAARTTTDADRDGAPPRVFCEDGRGTRSGTTRDDAPKITRPRPTITSAPHTTATARAIYQHADKCQQVTHNSRAAAIGAPPHKIPR